MATLGFSWVKSNRLKVLSFAKVSSPEEYYILAIFVPLLEHFITNLSSQFNGTLKNVFALQGLIPSKLSGYSSSKQLQLMIKICHLY